MELIKPGRFKAVVVEHGITETKSKDPQAAIRFGFEIGKEVSITVEIDKNPEGKDRNIIRWVNSFSGIGKKIDGLTATAKLDQYSSAVMALKEKLGSGKLKSSDDELGF